MQRATQIQLDVQQVPIASLNTSFSTPQLISTTTTDSSNSDDSMKVTNGDSGGSDSGGSGSGSESKVRSRGPRGKANSTSSLFLSKMIPHSADTSILVKCLSKAVYYQVFSNRLIIAGNNIFNEKLHPIGIASSKLDLNLPPSREIVEELLSHIFLKQRLSAECAVMSAAYVNKISHCRIKLCPANWRRVLLGALLLAEKVWEDQAVWNVDYTKSFPDISVMDLRQLEREFLIVIQFELTLRPSEYASYYFGLVALRERTEENYPIKALDKSTARSLEAKSHGLEEAVKQEYIHDRPYKSHNNYTHQSTVTLEQLQKIRSDYGHKHT